LGEDKKLYLVDYEYSGNASIYFDLGVFGYLNFPNAVKLAELYFERKLTLNDLVLLHIVNLQQYVQWYTVARIKEEKGLSSKLGVDFAKIAERYLIEGANHLKEIEKLLRYN
jgi:thiamine kinase-like enzyme